MHLFVARWPCELKVDQGWRLHSEIAHYIGNGPVGPFQFSDIALTGTGEGTWDRHGVHKPVIHKVGQRYVLLYIGNDDHRQPPHPSNQCIDMAVSGSLNGPWERVGGDGKILEPPGDAKYWNHPAENGVNNPAFLQHPDGGYFLYFKSEGAKMGLAMAERVEGPYIQLLFPVTANPPIFTHPRGPIFTAVIARSAMS